MHWACAKVSAAPDMPDDRLAGVLDAKLKGRQGMQYAAIAAHARALGRTSLAATLLDREPRASEQVRLQYLFAAAAMIFIHVPALCANKKFADGAASAGFE